MSRPTESSRSGPDEPERLNMPGWTTGQHLRTPQGVEPGSGVGAARQVSPMALRSGGDTQTRQLGWAQEGRAVRVPQQSARVPLPRSYPPTPSQLPVPVFGASGTSSSHYSSKWLARLSWRPSGGWCLNKANGQRRSGSSVPLGVVVPAEASAPSPDKAPSPAPPGVRSELTQGHSGQDIA